MHVGGDARPDEGLSRRIYVLLLGAMAAFLAIGFGPALASAGAALGPPPWNSGNGLCPASTSTPLGANTGCEWGIDVTSVGASGEATTDVINQDAEQGPYDSVEDVLVVVENDGTKPLAKLALGFEGSHAETFGFDGDGICSGAFLASPPCPLNSSPEATTGYEGPRTTFTVGATVDFGTVNFSPALQPGEHTYFSLELSPNTILTDSKVNNFVSTLQNAPSQAPAQYVAVGPGTNVTDNATVVGAHGAAAFGGDGSAAGTVVYKLYPDNLCQQTPVYTSAAKPVIAGVAAASDLVGASLPAGRYYWQIEYSGDGGAPLHNTTSVSLCGNEVLDVGGTAVTTKLSSNLVPLGTPITDSAVVVGVTPPGTATGSIVFNVNTDAACQKPVPGQTQTLLLTAGAATTAPITLPAGTYYLQAIYLGDAKNAPGASACGSEVLVVQAPSPPANPPIEKTHPFVFVETGEIESEYEFPEGGDAEDEAEVVEGATLARVHANLLGQVGGEPEAVAAKKGKKAKKCKKGLLKKGKKCVSNAPVQYGHTSLTIPAAGTYKLRIKPSAQVLAALKKGKTLNVKVTLKFTPKGTTVHIVKTTAVKVHLKLKKHSKGKKSKGKKK
jgi:hypothetical protein